MGKNGNAVKLEPSVSGRLLSTGSGQGRMCADDSRKSRNRSNHSPWYECVMKNSENKEMAQKYVEFMYDHNADYMDLTLKIAGRTSVYEEAGKTEGNEHTTAVLETLGAEQTQARPMVTTWAQIEEVLTGVVESCLGGADIQETLEAAKTEIEAIGM